jgi:hypothetical protein
MPETVQSPKVNAPGDQFTPGPAVRTLLDPSLAPLFWRAERVGASSAWWSHVPFAHWLVVATAPRVLVELGTHTGVSYAAFCEAVRLGGLATQCHAVDTWRGDLHTGEYGDEVFEGFRGFHDARYGRFSTLLRCSFDQALDKFADRSIDLLHIDGFHTYDAVRHDFESWLPKLSDKAVVLLHDTNERRDDFGVWRLWGELCCQYPSFEFLHGHGLGVLAVGNRPSAAIVDLCSVVDTTEAAMVRARFAALGEHWLAETSIASGDADRRQLEIVTSELVSARGTLQDLSAQVQAHEQDRAEFHAQTEAARAEAADIRRQLEIATSELVRARGTLQDLSAQVQAHEQDRARFQAQTESARAEAAYIRVDAQAQLERTRAEANRTVDEVRRLASSETRRAETAEAAAASTATRAAAIEASTVWRATRPIRAAVEPFPALRRTARRGLRVAWWTVSLQLRRRLRLRRALRAQVQAVAASPLFNRDWYIRQHEDVAANGMDAALHFVLYGAAEQRSPGPDFDTAWYLSTYPDVAESGANPLLHFMTFGAAEGRHPHRLHAEMRPESPSLRPRW